MSAVRIKKGDTVVVIAGKDKGKEGKVLTVNAKNHTAVVEGINMVTKHAKPSAANQQGGILHQEAPIDISNIAYSVDGKASKIGYEIKDGKKVRVAKATGKAID
ncbi:50S ribosomal protein L24 [Lachnospira multipara]|jgi:large subunit ribosomal protein L24|uniref:50S ribosomal protein L24 n=1 Tax=Lachnospira multipara TaxID=28051 RepID=UPI0004894774|nr:50S ribosomal protein L24 [Lachnospira multipara]